MSHFTATNGVSIVVHCCSGRNLHEKSIYALKAKVTQLCPTLCNPMGYTVYGILQAKILEWVSFPFSRGSSQPRDRTQVSRRQILYQLSHQGSPRDSLRLLLVGLHLLTSCQRSRWLGVQEVSDIVVRRSCFFFFLYSYLLGYHNYI